jgi:hypothetical protein
MKVIFNDPAVQVTYDESKKRVTQSWKGFAASDKFRKAIDSTVQFVNSNEVNSILSDTLKQNVVNPEDSKYASSVMPKLFQSGLKKMAFVIPNSALTKMSLDNFAKDAPKHPGVKFFDSVSDASTWLG